MVGPKKKYLLPRINIGTQRKKILKIPSMHDGWSKSAKIVLSKSIFMSKINHFKNVDLGDHFL